MYNRINNEVGLIHDDFDDDNDDDNDDDGNDREPSKEAPGLPSTKPRRWPRGSRERSGPESGGRPEEH